MKKSLLTILAILTMALSAKADIYEGTCGDSLTWRLDTETETLTISGSGDMKNYNSNQYSNISPWTKYSEQLAYVVIGDSVTSIGNHAFCNCDFIKSVYIGDTVTSIGEFAFSNCSRLHKIHMPESLKAIRRSTFMHCISLRNITIPKSVEEVPFRPFYGDDKLVSIVVDPENKTYDSRDNCNAIILTESDKLVVGCKGTVIANTVKTIGNYAFLTVNIESVDIPNSVKTIGDGSFLNCMKLKHVTFGDSLETIGDCAFGSCDQIEELYIPSSVKNIENQAFSSCGGLKSISVDPANKTYDSRENCNAIICTETGELVRGCDNTVLPNSIRSIGVDAFSDCEGIQSVVLPDSVTSIKHYAYLCCYNLDSIVLPAALKTIESEAFYSCYPKTIRCFATTPPECGDGAFFSYIYETCTLYVPFGSLQAYKEAEIWKEFWNIVELPEGYSVDENQTIHVAAFPNPTTDFVNINCENMKNIDVFTMDGKLANKIAAQSDEIQIDMSMLPRGTYFLRIETKEGFTTRKIVKK